MGAGVFGCVAAAAAGLEGEAVALFVGWRAFCGEDGLGGAVEEAEALGGLDAVEGATFEGRGVLALIGFEGFGALGTELTDTEEGREGEAEGGRDSGALPAGSAAV